MERDGASQLHAQLMRAVERCEHVQERSRSLVADHAALHAAVSETLAQLRQERAARGRQDEQSSGK